MQVKVDAAKFSLETGKPELSISLELLPASEIEHGLLVKALGEQIPSLVVTRADVRDVVKLNISNAPKVKDETINPSAEAVAPSADEIPDAGSGADDAPAAA